MENWSDLYRIFLGEADTANVPFYLEVVLRTVVMYLYTIFLARMVGQGGIGQIGPFEFVLVIAVGSAAGDPMFYPEVGLLQGILVITIVILLHRATGYVLERHRRLEETVEGRPLLVIEHGDIRGKVLGSGSVTRRELFSLLRAAGIRDTGEVERAYLEPSGKLSLFRYAGGKARKGETTLPE
jgi:uncharacterized membrane protein YcaP (DUF421 family)